MVSQAGRTWLDDRETRGPRTWQGLYLPKGFRRYVKDGDYDGDLASFRRLNVVRDALGLVHAFGYRSVAVIGHDFGSPIAAWCAVTRPDVFTSVALMSAPFGGTGSLPFDTADDPPRTAGPAGPSLFDELAALPRPRKHYQRYYRTREANENMWRAPQGLHAFLRGYYHYKSADWAGNTPFRLASRTAAEMAKMPTYYIMDFADGMAETVAKHMPSAAEIAANTWLPDSELRVYAEEYGRTGFQGGLNHYRSGGIGTPEQQLFAGRPSTSRRFSSRARATGAATRALGLWSGCKIAPAPTCMLLHMLDGAGHWVQQEQPEETSRLLIEFLREV